MMSVLATLLMALIPQRGPLKRRGRPLLSLAMFSWTRRAKNNYHSCQESIHIQPQINRNSYSEGYNPTIMPCLVAAAHLARWNMLIEASRVARQDFSDNPA